MYHMRFSTALSTLAAVLLIRMCSGVRCIIATTPLIHPMCVQRQLHAPGALYSSAPPPSMQQRSHGGQTRAVQKVYLVKFFCPLFPESLNTLTLE